MASIRERFLSDEPVERQPAIMEEKEAIFASLRQQGVPPSPGSDGCSTAPTALASPTRR